MKLDWQDVKKGESYWCVKHGQVKRRECVMLGKSRPPRFLFAGDTRTTPIGHVFATESLAHQWLVETTESTIRAMEKELDRHREKLEAQKAELAKCED